MLSTSTSSGQTQSEHDVLFFLELSPPTQDLESLLLETLSDEKKCHASTPLSMTFFYVSLANRQLIISTNLITQRFEHQ